jgi:hypothetical protein
MFKNWNLLRILTLVGGGLACAAGVVFPVASAFALPIGSGLVGLALKAPGTMTATDLQAHGEAVAGAVVPAVVNAAVSAAGRSPGQVGSLVATAAAGALADMGPKK